MGRCPGEEPLTLTRCYNCEISQPYKALEGGNSSVAKLTTKEYKGENFFFHIFLALLIFYFRSFNSMICADPMVAGAG